MRKVCCLLLIVLGIALSACEPDVHKDFQANFQEDISRTPNAMYTRIKFNRTNGHLALSDNHGYVTIWDTRQGVEVSRFRAHGYSAEVMTFSPDGDYLLTREKQDGPVLLWDMQAGKSVNSLRGHWGEICAVPKTNYFVVADYEGILLLDYKNRAYFPEVFSNGQTGIKGVIDCDENSRNIVIESRDTVEVWVYDEAQGKPTLTFVAGMPYPDKKTRIVDVKLYDKGRRLFVVMENGTIDNWLIKEKEKIGTFTAKLKMVRAAVFLPDKNVIALSGDLYPYGHDDLALEYVSTKSKQSILAALDAVQIEYIPTMSSLLAIWGGVATFHPVPEFPEE